MGFKPVILNIIGVGLIVFGLATSSRAQQELSTPPTPTTNSSGNNPNRGDRKQGLSDVKILLPGDAIAAPTTTAPSAEPSLYLRGITALQIGNYAEAVQTLRLLVEREPNNAAAYRKLGVAYEGLRQYKDAVVVLKMAIRIRPEVVDAEDYYHLSRAYTALEKFPLALESIKLALYIKRAEQVNAENGNPANGPSRSELHYAAGLAFYNLQRYREGIEELKQAIALNPNHAPAQFGLALCYLSTGDRKAAEKQQAILEPLDPANAARIAKLLATRPDNTKGLVTIFKTDP